MTLKELEIVAAKLKKYLKKDDMPSGEIPSIGVYLNCLDRKAIKNICSEDFKFEADFDYIKIFNNKKLLENMDCVPALKLLLNDTKQILNKLSFIVHDFNELNSVFGLEKLYELYCNENILKSNKLMPIMILLHSKIDETFSEFNRYGSTEALKERTEIIKLMIDVAQECYPGDASYLKALKLMKETSHFNKARLIKTIQTSAQSSNNLNENAIYGTISKVKDSAVYKYIESLLLEEGFIKLSSSELKRWLLTKLVEASKFSIDMIELIYITILQAISLENFDIMYERKCKNVFVNDLDIILEAKDIETARYLAELALNEQDVMGDEHDNHMDTILKLKVSEYSPYSKRAFIDVMTGKNNDELDNILYKAVIYSDGDKEKELDESIFQIKK